jgi:DNA-directed RNA polymerase II subunit RPB2
MDHETTWKIIDSYFQDNPQCLVRHHIESYNDFFKTGIFQIFKEKNPIVINSAFDETIQDFRHQCVMYFGGKKGDKIYFGKPVIYDNENSHYMFPNDSRLRNMTYGMTIHYDIEIDFIDILEQGQQPFALSVDMMEKVDGGNSNHLELEDHDYTKEHMDDLAQKAGNFKERSMDMFEKEELESLDKTEMEGGVTEGERTEGGGPKKVERKKRVRSVEVEMTPAMATQLKEATEKSVEVGQNRQTRTVVLEQIYLGKFPIMVQSEHCVLAGLPREVRFSMGECKNDYGGYFIIDGKEKTVVPQEKFGDNMLYIRKVDDEKYLYSAEIRSVSENASKPIRTLAVKIKTPNKKYTFNNIVVNIPNVRNPIPLFVVFRALGIISDKDIITMCLLDLEKYESMMDLFIPSVHDAGGIMSQQAALIYIATLTKYGTVTYALEVLSDFFLPHVGELNFIQKAYYLGYIVFRLFSVYLGIEPPTDRDNFKYKRVELVGSLLYDLFREYYTIQQKQIHLDFEKRLYYNKSLYAENLPGLIQQNYRDILKERYVEIGFKKAFKGNWGSETHTKRIGVVQDLNRLSFNSAISHLRKTNLPLDSSAKLVGPRVLHSSQWGFIDPIDTPDGANIGLHKSLAIATTISRGYSREPMIAWLREKIPMKLLEEVSPTLLSTMTRVIVNGLWAGSVVNPIETIEKIHLFRRNALIPSFTSATFEIKLNTIFIYTDAGRLCRPIFYVNAETGKISFDNKDTMDKLKTNQFDWQELTTGFNKKKIPSFQKDLPRIYELNELYSGVTSESNPARIEKFLKEQAIIDYIDPSESENALIAVKYDDFEKSNKKYTHLEIHESLIMGVMCNQIIFPENNPPTRNAFSCGQSKQAVSMYHTNYQVRMDKTAVVLNNGQIPLIKSKYFKYINNEENPYGENAIVAIMCYTGYNMEDSVLINEASIKRGMFNTTYYTVYETHEESSKNEDTLVDKKFTNIEMESNVVGTKPGYDYSKLDKYGIIRENTLVDDKTVLIGLTSNSIENKSVRVDNSKTPKKGQLGIVDKSFITEGEEGERIAKVRLREIRIPNLGDKIASRSGQKGTVGMIIPEQDMPFTKDGIRPDIIINPHAIPSRMTIGQLVECITGKACAMYGGFGDCTGFDNKGSKIGLFGEYLTKVGFHSSGNELLYNGMTGEQIESDIFIGPTYYMRLKHMVKDKINYRARGPMTALTRQPVSGRANDGGLRIGEMERDILISHGINNFLRESMLERGDKYYMAVCNQTGMMAVYNPSKNLFMSPMADGPIQFIGSLDGKEMHVENITRFGRNFSIVCVPYTFKLLLQELQTANIQMRLITDDNIEQLENLSFSKNISKLTQIDNMTPVKVVEMTKQRLTETRNTKRADTPDERYASASPLPPFVYSPEGPPPPLNPSSARTPEGPPPPLNPSSARTPEGPPPPLNPSSARTPEGPPPPLNAPREPYSPEPPVGPYSPGPYSPESEDLARTPEGPPPPNTLREKDFQRGETVLLRGGGDKKPNRQWFIKDTGGGEFITIETHDMDGIDDIQDSIKVVSPCDIFRPSEIVYDNHPMQIDPYSYNQMPNMMNPMNNGMNNGMVPNIEVNPVIKIVNGPDNSIATSNDGKPQQHINEPFSQCSQQQEETSINNISPTSESPIDFSKLIIKKV